VQRDTGIKPDEQFAANMMRAQRPLHVYVYSLLGAAQGVDDVLQEINLVLWRKMGEFDPRREFLP
jgi:RNA polymerase sigma-70 factor, ECF subfamily